MTSRQTRSAYRLAESAGIRLFNRALVRNGSPSFDVPTLRVLRPVLSSVLEHTAVKLYGAQTYGGAFLFYQTFRKIAASRIDGAL